MKPEKTLAEKFDPIESPDEALAFTNEHFEHQKERTDGELGGSRELIELCDTLITRWPDSQESLEARKLISRCYTQMAEHEAARVAFLGCADEAGQRAKARLLACGKNPQQAAAEAASTTANIVLGESNRLFEGCNEYIAALSYGDIILTRYPATEQSRRARLLLGEYGFRTKLSGVSVREFRAIIEEAPESPSAMRDTSVAASLRHRHASRIRSSFSSPFLRATSIVSARSLSRTRFMARTYPPFPGMA